MITGKSRIPSALAIAFKDEQDLRIIDVQKDSFIIESAHPIEFPAVLTICFFNYDLYDYEELKLNDCGCLESEDQEFSCFYKIAVNDAEMITAYSSRAARLLTMIETEQEKSNGDHFRSSITEFDFITQKQKQYPFELDNEFAKNYPEQEACWYEKAAVNIDHTAFKETASAIELAFFINTPELYNEFLISDFGETIVRHLEKLHLSGHGLFSHPFQRVYIGNQFCHNLLPSNQQLFLLLDKAYEEGYSITLAFTYMRECFLTEYITLFDELERWSRKKAQRLEIVVNDWGMLELLKNKVEMLTPVLGTLLNKRKKDPRFKWKWGADRFARQREENNLNCAHFIVFLKGYGITRFEFESFGQKNSIPAGTHSLHFPFYQLNTSQYCTLYAECINLNRSRQIFVKTCPKYCSDFIFLYPKHLNWIGRGNSIFGFDNSVMTDPAILNAYIDQGIDRLVYSI